MSSFISSPGNAVLKALLATVGGAALIGFQWAGPATARTVDDKLSDIVSIHDYGVVADLVADDKAAIQAALNSGAKVVDFLNLTTLIDSSITIPAGVRAVNMNITAGTAGIEMVLVNSGCHVHGKLTGTGTVSTVERGIYPAANAVVDVTLDVEVTNITFGVQAQPLAGTAVADRPKRWKGRVYAHDIVGTVGASEGYGLLLSPAESCEIEVEAKNIARHASYLSAGSRYNKITTIVDDCDNYAVQLFSTSAQDATEQNEITIFAQNLDETVAGQGGALAVVQKCHRNDLKVFHDGDGTTTYSVLIEGSSTGPYPLGNTLDGKITGQFTGVDVVRLVNQDSTKIVKGMSIHAYATSDVIGIRRSGTNGTLHAGFYENIDIDAQAQAIKGIYIECNTQPSYIGPCWIHNNGAALRVDDQSSGFRQGFSRRATFSGTTAAIAATNSGDTTPAIEPPIQTAGRSLNVILTGSSVQYANTPFWTGYLTPGAENQQPFRAYNGHTVAQTLDYRGVVEGD